MYIPIYLPIYKHEFILIFLAQSSTTGLILAFSPCLFVIFFSDIEGPGSHYLQLFTYLFDPGTAGWIVSSQSSYVEFLAPSTS